jgi:hypothetical protein
MWENPGNTDFLERLVQWLERNPLVRLAVVGAAVTTIVFTASSLAPIKKLVGSAQVARACAEAVQIGIWPSPATVLIDAKHSIVHADFSNVAGYDEVAVLFIPPSQVTVLGASGIAWRYPPQFTEAEVRSCVQSHLARRGHLAGKNTKIMTMQEFCQRGLRCQ